MVKGREVDLYDGVVRMLERDGYTVLREFSVWPGEGADARDVDAMGFRWDKDGNPDAWAVEAKDGDKPRHVLGALPQAIEYGLVAPQVSIAARIATENLAYAAQPIRDLGIGYVCAGPTGASSTISPRRMDGWPKSDLARWLRHAAALCLVTKELRSVVDADWWTHTSVRPNGSTHYAVHTDEPVQIAFSAKSQPGEVAAVVWAEKKSKVKRIVEGLDPVRLHDAMAVAGVRGEISKRERSAWGPLKPAQDRAPIGRSAAETERTLKLARRVLSGKRMIPVVEIRIPLWDFTALPDRGAATQTVKDAMARLAPVRAVLKAALTA